MKKFLAWFRRRPKTPETVVQYICNHPNDPNHLCWPYKERFLKVNPYRKDK
jgi:hypothetical protein